MMAGQTCPVLNRKCFNVDCGFWVKNQGKCAVVVTAEGLTSLAHSADKRNGHLINLQVVLTRLVAGNE